MMVEAVEVENNSVMFIVQELCLIQCIATWHFHLRVSMCVIVHHRQLGLDLRFEVLDAKTRGRGDIWGLPQ